MLLLEWGILRATKGKVGPRVLLRVSSPPSPTLCIYLPIHHPSLCLPLNLSIYLPINPYFFACEQYLLHCRA